MHSAPGSAKRKLLHPAGSRLSFEKLIDDYVSDAHRKNPGAGCVFSALAPEIARSDKRTRALTSDQVKADLSCLPGSCQARTSVRQDQKRS